MYSMRKKSKIRKVKSSTVYYFLDFIKLQGSLIAAAMVEVFLGATGLIGILMRFIGPISITVTIATLGISLCPVTIAYSSSYWPISIT